MAGSLPAALLTMVLLSQLDGAERLGARSFRAFALFITAAGLFCGSSHMVGRRLQTRVPAHAVNRDSVLAVCRGVLVALTSVGAGALGTVALVYLYPFRLSGAKLVGTDLAHAIPLALVAGGGHLLLGNIDLRLLATLLIGSIPGILLGSVLSVRASESLVRNAIAAVLIVVAARLVW
jgi:uncharacterized membrane protein YfcA